MIISDNPKPTLVEFQDLMLKTDKVLNDDAKERESYYQKRSGTKLESDVFDVLTDCAKGTAFENTIELVSGSAFPDIIANKLYGVEVKSTEKNHWTSTGSSILESTRNKNIERIYLTFGKLGKPVQFLSRPYEECLSDIAVTHYPRYKINMRIGKGETIFDKIGISYDELRIMDNTVAPVSRYYRSKLKDGESLWWAADNDSEPVPPTVRLWSTLKSNEKNIFTAQGYALFPEIISDNGSKKYQRFALWLATRKSIINTNIRDQFSAGGKVSINTSIKTFDKMPAIFGKIVKHKELIINTILDIPTEILIEYWNVDKIEDNRIAQWCGIVAAQYNKDISFEKKLELLNLIFNM